ncbi:MAG: TlpA disulfide reductase family protein [Pseudomonadota bacterium]
MRSCLGLLLFLLGTAPAQAQFTEPEFRKALGVADNVRVAYRGPDCAMVSYAGFAAVMARPGIISDIDRSADGSELTVTARQRGGGVCPAAYPLITEMPPFDLRDLSGKRLTAAGLKGKPTLVSFYFAQCKPCILEVAPLNRLAAARADLNFLAVTFDEAPVARQFVARYQLRWRVLPDAREFIDRVRVKQYPTLVLFDANGRLLGARLGGVRDEFEAATVGPQLTRWLDGLLRAGVNPR